MSLKLIGPSSAALDAAYVRQGKRYTWQQSRMGPVATDVTAVTANATPDGTYNKSYAVASSALPSDWPVEAGKTIDYFATTSRWQAKGTNVTANPVDRTMRIMCDGPKFAMEFQGATEQVWVHLDGRPAALTPYVQAQGFMTITFPDARPRLIELRTRAAIRTVYTANPYRCWKPAPTLNPSVIVMGDSYVLPTVTQPTGGATVYNGMGLYQSMPDMLGITDMWADGIGSTGYLRESSGGAADRYSDRLATLTALNPDMLVVHGGGATDLNAGSTTAQIITAANALFTAARAALPRAKLVFVEGFAPPNGYSTFNPSYTTIRQGVQAALTSVGVYYLDVATTIPPLNGTGYVGALAGTGNNDLYIGSDGIHPTIAGHQYLRGFLAGKLRKVLADDGALVNTLIT